jgi:hypothetical protein
MAQANFNIRGWQGRWRYTASTALFFIRTLDPAAIGAMRNVGGSLSRAVVARRCGDLVEASAVTAQLDLLQFPEHPHKGHA